MNFQGIIKLSIIGLKTNKTRSALTMLGIIIGIASVIVIMSVGAGAQSLILDQIQKLGTNLLGIMPGAAVEKGPPAAAFGITVTTLKYEDELAIKREIPEVVAVASYVRGIDTISWQNQQVDTTFVGTTADYLEVNSAQVGQGRFFTAEEERSISRIAVLGSTLASDLFGGVNPLGQHLKIRRESFEVIGVIKERGKVAFENVDDQVFVPLKTAQKLLLGIEHVNLIRVKVDKSDNLKPTIKSIKDILRIRHNIGHGQENDFDVRNQADALEVLTTVTNALKFFLAAVAAISLLVGGIGIMNIMYVAVTERTREIGLRKAVGATKNNVLKQFLVEAVIITLFGGLFGIIIGALISGLVALIANYLGYHWQYIVSLSSIMVGFFVAALVGLIFGFFPAKAAASLEPIGALRYE